MLRLRELWPYKQTIYSGNIALRREGNTIPLTHLIFRKQFHEYLTMLNVFNNVPRIGWVIIFTSLFFGSQNNNTKRTSGYPKWRSLQHGKKFRMPRVSETWLTTPLYLLYKKFALYSPVLRLRLRVKVAWGHTTLSVEGMLGPHIVSS